MEEHRLIDGFGVTKEWVEETMSKEFSDQAKITKVEVLTVCGYMSAIARIDLSWKSGNSDLPATAIAKIPSGLAAEEAWKSSGIIEEGQPEDPIYVYMHKMEIQIYSLFKKVPAENLHVPKLYGYRPIESHPVLLIEDINDSYHIDLVDGFTDKQLYSIMDEIVSLHKWSKKNEILWKGLSFEMEFDPNGEYFTGSILKMMNKLAKSEPKLTNLLDILKRNFASNTLWIKQETERAFSTGKACFIHGDLWAPQILWRGDKIAAIVDWALCRPGPRTEDILRVLTTCCSTDTRRRMTEPLLEYYVNKMDGEITLDEVKEDYTNCLPASCTMMSFAVMMWSNSAVIRDGKGREEERIKTVNERLISLIEDTIKVHSWK